MDTLFTGHMTKINGNELRKVEAGAYEVTIDGTTYRIVGGGREWALNIKIDSGTRTHLGTFTSLKAAASDLAMRTFRVAA